MQAPLDLEVWRVHSPPSAVYISNPGIKGMAELPSHEKAVAQRRSDDKAPGFVPLGANFLPP
jgi:hypothetical protein